MVVWTALRFHWRDPQYLAGFLLTRKLSVFLIHITLKLALDQLSTTIQIVGFPYGNDTASKLVASGETTGKGNGVERLQTGFGFQVSLDPLVDWTSQGHLLGESPLASPCGYFCHAAGEAEIHNLQSQDFRNPKAWPQQTFHQGHILGLPVLVDMR